MGMEGEGFMGTGVGRVHRFGAHGSAVLAGVIATVRNCLKPEWLPLHIVGQTHGMHWTNTSPSP